MKKSVWILIITLIVGLILPVYGEGDPIKVKVDGNHLDFDVPPQIIEGRTLVPLREIFEALGSNVKWDAETRTAIGVKGSTTVKLPIGEKQALKNGQIIELDVAATVIDGRTLVPVRFIAESLGAEVEWDGDTRTVIVNDMGMENQTYVEDEIVYIQGSGGSYTGYIQNDNPTGEGVIKFNSGNEFKALKYDGEFKWGKIHGQGTMEYLDGSKYVGEFKDDQKHGKGVMTWENGKKYDGQWDKDSIHGDGIMTYENGDVYEGPWENGKANGEGVMTYANGDEFTGTWKDNKINGEGTMTYANGDKYVGTWKDGFYNGEGTMTYANGDKYEGTWRYGKEDGAGLFTAANGESYRGTWQDGKLVNKY